MAELLTEPVEEQGFLDRTKYPEVFDVPQVDEKVVVQEMSLSEPDHERALGQHAITAEQMEFTEARPFTEQSVVEALAHAQLWFEKLARAARNHKRELGAAFAASLVSLLGAPTLAQGQEEEPTQPVQPPPVSARPPAEINYIISEDFPENQGTGGYPLAEAPFGTLDKHDNRARECYSYVDWRTEQDGVNPERLKRISMGEVAEEEFEIIDTTPAKGAVVVFGHVPDASPEESHTFYIEEVLDAENGVLLISDYNSGKGGPGKFRKAVVSFNKLKDVKYDVKVYHFEQPQRAGGLFMGATLDKKRKGLITKSSEYNGLRQNTYLINGDQVLLFDKEGSLTSFDKANDFSINWRLKLPASTNERFLGIQPKKKGEGYNLVVWEEEPRKKVIKAIDIGLAQSMKLEENGSIAGYKGKKKVWAAAGLASASRAAKAATRKATLAAKRASAHTGRKARSVHQATAHTKAKALKNKSDRRKNRKH